MEKKNTTKEVKEKKDNSAKESIKDKLKKKRTSRKERGDEDICVYYGCPNSKKVRKLNLLKKKYI